MFRPIYIAEIELGEPLLDIEKLHGYSMVRALIRHHGQLIGQIDLPVQYDVCPAGLIREAIIGELAWPLLLAGLGNWLRSPAPKEQAPTVAEILSLDPARADAGMAGWPSVTVAVCTRGIRPTLDDCLTAIGELDYPHLDLLVVDNAPTGDETKRLVQERYPHIRYICEPQPGLDNARNRALIEAKGEIIAYTDDDVIVDPHWARALAKVFIEDPDVMAVTGLVIAAELETEAQWLFEQYGGFSRGFDRSWNRGDHLHPGDVTRRHGGTGKFGTGANMAFRRQHLLQVGGFDPALDVGTPANGGGDLDIFYRVLKEGHTLVYEPQALVRHFHRRTTEKLTEQIRNNGIGFYAFLVRNFLAYPDERKRIFLLGLWWFWWWNIRRLIASYLRPLPIPRSLIWTEMWGSLRGLFRYQRARRQQPRLTLPQTSVADGRSSPQRKKRAATAVRSLDLSRPLAPLEDVRSYRQTILYIMWREKLLGQVDITNDYHPISALQISDAIAAQLNLDLLQQTAATEGELWNTLLKELGVLLGAKPDGEVQTASLPANISASIVIATFDRPHDLHRCLTSLSRQQTSRAVEIVVVDNNPDSGLTWPVVSNFPTARYLRERRQGLSYARNTGILNCTGEIIICTDDDVVAPPDWLEKILAPFHQGNVGVVTGNVLPQELETEAQQLFEQYGGLGRGFKPMHIDQNWFNAYRYQAVPTWNLGATANAAFHRQLFDDPRVGLMDEALGAGSPTGCSEDTLLFYQALRAGYMLVYQPTAYVWHNHRQTPAALRKQLYNYSKGHVAYHLTTFRKYRDWRALLQICLWLPLLHIWRIWQRLRRRNNYPLHLNVIEIAGNFLGPWAWVQSLWRVRRLGRNYTQDPAPVAPLKTFSATREAIGEPK